MTESSEQIQNPYPEIFGHTSYNVYLQEYYKWKKKLDPRFSYQAWSSECGLIERSFLRLIVMGKRPMTMNSLPKILKSLPLNNKEKNYFFHLVHFSQAKSLVDREHHYLELCKMMPQKKMKGDKSFRYLSSLAVPIVHNLINYLGKSKISELERLVPLKKDDMDGAIKTLLDLKLIQWQQEEQVYSVVEKYIDITGELGNLPIQIFHSKSLELAREAINLNPSERYFTSVFTCLSKEEYQFLCNELNNFRQKTIIQKKTKEKIARRVYQLNINLIPHSHEFIQARGPEPETAWKEDNEELRGEAL